MAKLASGPTIVFHPDAVEIPPGVSDLGSFRAWARSDAFPEHGRIDWVAGRLEIDMSPEDLNSHAHPKSAFAIRFGLLVQHRGLGAVYIDRTRLSNREADLSAEPDLLILLFETLEAGRARLVPRVSRREGRYIEIEGTVDLVVEIVSDSSEDKDTARLRVAYEKAKVREYWIVDMRGEELSFELLTLRGSTYVRTRPDAGGWRRSRVLACEVRPVRFAPRAGLVLYDLEVRE